MNKKSFLTLVTLAILTLVLTSPSAWAAGAQTGAGLVSLAPLMLIMLIFYFLLIRPQQKKLKMHKNMISALKKGDGIITSGGIYGTIQDVSEDTVKVDIANGVHIKIKRDTISDIIPAIK